MLPPPLRPLVPLSAVALLGWGWYTFRKKRNPCARVKEDLLDSSAARKQSMVENVAVQEAPASGSTIAIQDVKTHSHFQSQVKHEDDQNLDRNCSQLSSTMDDLSGLPGSSQATVLTSTPIAQHLKGIRPEPEGEVSRAQASLLLTEKPENEPEKEGNSVKSHLDCKAIERESCTHQPTGIVCSKEDGVTNVSEKQSEHAPSLSEVNGLVMEVIDSAAEEITAIGGDILKRKGLAELRITPQSQVQPQDEMDVNDGLAGTKGDLCALSETAKERASSAHGPSDSSSTFLSGKDSGCSTYHSEDGAEAEKAVEKTSSNVSASSDLHHALARKNGKLSRQKAHDGANGVKCVHEESRVFTKRGMQSRSLPHKLWNIEVPTHLVGRLIGKKGKYISSLKQSSGAKIYVSTLPYTYDFQICHIEGSEAQVENALGLIRKKFKDLDLSNRLSSLQPPAVHSLPVTSWLLLPQEGTVEVIIPRVEAANCLFVQQHTHPTYYSLCSLTEQMLFCYCHSGCPSLPTPVEGVLCAAPSPDGAWWRAQVIQHFKDSDVVQIRYVDYGGYVTVDLASLKQIRSDFVTLPFQASEVMLENIAPLPGQGKFSVEAKEALEELTQGIPLIMKVTGGQRGLPLVHMWRHAGEEVWCKEWMDPGSPGCLPP